MSNGSSFEIFYENCYNPVTIQNIRAVDDHQYDYATGTIYIDLVNGCEKLGDYVVNVVQARFGK